MRVSRMPRRLTAMAIMISMCTMPVAVTAATTQAPAASPIVALSMLGSDVSRAALCGAAGTAAAGTAAAAATTTTATNGQATPPGCVLPAVDQAAPVAQATSYPVAETRSFIGPLLAGLAGLVFVVAALYLSGHSDDEDQPASAS